MADKDGYVPTVVVESGDSKEQYQLGVMPSVVTKEDEIKSSEEDQPGDDGSQAGSEEAPKPHVEISYSMERTAYNQDDFDEEYDGDQRPSRSMKTRYSDTKNACECSGRCAKKKVFGFLPFIPIMMKYTTEDLFYDCIAGLTVSVLQIPQGMSYALLANVEPVYGLYTCFFTTFIYFFFGTSRHVNIGTFAVVSLMVGSAVDKICGSSDTGDAETTYAPSTVSMLDATGTLRYAINATVGVLEEEDDCSILAATAVTFVCGLIQLFLGISRLGIVVIYLSDPLTRGFTTGAAIHVFTSQLKYVFGISVGSYSGGGKLVWTYYDLFMGLPDTNWFAFGLSCVCMIIIFITKEYINPHVKRKIKAPIPIDLIVVLGTAIWCEFADWEERFNINVVGEIPTGLPAPSFPPTDMMVELIGDAIAIAIVAFAISISMAEGFANKYNYKIDANQELLAYGICNTICANLYCYTTCVSLSRSVVQENLGCRSQVAGLFCCLVMLLVLLWLAFLFEPLPEAVLGAVVIVALKGMFMQFKDLKTLWPISKTDWVVWVVVFTAVCLFDVALGLLIGVAFEILTVIGKTQMPYCAIEGRIPDTDIYKDKRVYAKAVEVPGVCVFRCETSLYFANTRHVMSRLYKRSGCHPKKLRIAQVKVMDKKAKAQLQLEKHEKDVLKAEEKGKPIPELKNAEEIEIAQQLIMPEPTLHHVVMDMTTMGYIDAQAVTCLGIIIRDYKLVNVEVFYAGCKGGVRAMLERSGFFDKCDRDYMFPQVHDAVLAALEDYPEELEKMRAVKTTTDQYPPEKEEDDDDDDDDEGDTLDQPPLNKYEGTKF